MDVSTHEPLDSACRHLIWLTPVTERDEPDPHAPARRLRDGGCPLTRAHVRAPPSATREIEPVESR